jgi:Concanavalin A-like lectin/glucanases superfamily
MFGNGLFINHDLCEGWCNNGGNFFYTSLAQTSLTPARGTVEFWFKFKYGSENFNHAYFFDTRDKAMSHYPDQNWQTDGVITAGWNGWDYGSYGKRFFFCVGQYNAATCVYTPDYSAAPSGDLDFTDGTLMHFAFVWDAAGMAGSGDTMRIYVNGENKGATQTQWVVPSRIDPYLFLGSSPNCCDWDHHYNAVKGITDNFVIMDYAKTDFSNRFIENPLGCDEGGLPELSVGITKKSGTQNARIWTVSLSNKSGCPAENAQVDAFNLSQTAGTACTPVITSPLSFPLGVGNIAANSQASGTVTLDFTGCPNNTRFKAIIPFSSNNGAVIGSKNINNQFR